MNNLPSLSDEEFAALVQRAAAMPDAPAAWMQRATAAWSLRQQAVPAAAVVDAARALAGGVVRAAGRRLAAVLTFDSWAATPLASGLRSGRGDTRQFLFSADGRDVDLRITAQDGRYSMAGQILGPDETGVVTLMSASGGAEAPRRAALDAMGEFHLDDVAPARYVVTLALGHDEIVLPLIDVGLDGGQTRP